VVARQNDAARRRAWRPLAAYRAAHKGFEPTFAEEAALALKLWADLAKDTFDAATLQSMEAKTVACDLALLLDRLFGGDDAARDVAAVQAQARVPQVPPNPSPGSAPHLHPSSSRAEVRHEETASAAAGAAEVRTLVQQTINSNPAVFGDFAERQEMDWDGFVRLIALIVPDMGKQEAKALFISMDTSNDGIIQAAEIFSDLTMAILHNRMRQQVAHPLEGSYHCLPRPPFHSDSKQLAAIEVLKVVFDEAVAAHARPVQAVAPMTHQVRGRTSQFLARCSSSCIHCN